MGWFGNVKYFDLNVIVLIILVSFFVVVLEVIMNWV